VTHKIILDSSGVVDYRSAIGYFARTLMQELRLVSSYDVLYGKVKAFVQDGLFDRSVDLEDADTLRNLAQQDVRYGFVYVDEEAFKKYKPASFRRLLDSFSEYRS